MKILSLPKKTMDTKQYIIGNWFKNRTVIWLLAGSHSKNLSDAMRLAKQHKCRVFELVETKGVQDETD